jgi:hypothetical protein
MAIGSDAVKALDPELLGTVSYADARAMRENFAAKLAWIEVRRRMGELVDRYEVALELGKVYRIARDALLNIPSRLAAQIVALTEIADIQDVIAEEIRATLDELSTALGRIAEEKAQ